MKSKIIELWLFIAFCCTYISASKDDDVPSKDPYNTNTLGSIFLLTRINEGLVKASLLNEQIFEKLKYMETLIGKLEEQQQSNSIKIDYMERSLDAIKQAFDYIKYSQLQDKPPIIIKEQSTDLSQKIEGLVDGISSLQIKPPSTYSQNQSSIEELPLVSALLGTIDPFDCTDVLRLFGNKSGIYKIKPPHAKESIEVYCDQQTRGGGWTVIQNRFNGSVDFYRRWDLYKSGFGKVRGEYWLGLENIHLITNYKINEIYFLLEDWEDDKVFAIYDSFAVGPESTNYSVPFLGVYEGNAGDSFRGVTGQAFSTFDRDNDKGKGNCAAYYTGAWWYNNCFDSNLNGKYHTGITLTNEEKSKAIIWGKFKGHRYSLKATRMMVRPRVNQVLNEAAGK